MIDVVAKALARWAVPYNDWDSMMEEQRERWRDGARATIGAMREPTEAMQAAAINALVRERNACRAAGTKGWSYSEIDITWAAMLGEVLTPADG